MIKCSSTGVGLVIYAEYSWYDIELDVLGEWIPTDIGNAGTMHCGPSPTYPFSCDIFEWNCTNATDECVSLPSSNPTSNPTTVAPPDSNDNHFTISLPIAFGISALFCVVIIINSVFCVVCYCKKPNKINVDKVDELNNYHIMHNGNENNNINVEMYIPNLPESDNSEGDFAGDNDVFEQTIEEMYCVVKTDENPTKYH